MSTRFIAIDPGTTESALLVYNTETASIEHHEISDNAQILCSIRRFGLPMAIEMIASYGMPVGKDVFETTLWIGRFIQANQPHECAKVYRMEVKMHVCKSPKAKDSNIRQALLDMHEPTGGGKTPQVGTKAQQGPLYGIKSHLWAALGVAVTYAHTLSECKRLEDVRL